MKPAYHVFVALENSLMQPADPQMQLLVPLLVVAAGGIYVWMRVRGRSRAAAEKQARLLELERSAAEQWTRITEAGFVASTPVEGVHLRAGELAVTSTPSTLFQVAAARGGTTVGTRLSLAGVPVYLAQTVRSNSRALKELGSGRLLLTNRRFLFISSTQSLDVALGKITYVETGADYVQLTISGRAMPVVLTVGNPILLTMVMNKLIEGSLEVRAPSAVSP